MDRHRLAEERSIALHAAVAAKLVRDPAVLARARARVRSWRAERRVAAYYVDAWERELERDLDELCALLVDRGERARALRQASPFAGALGAAERWAIWRSVSGPAEP